MNILIIGSGGREFALGRKIKSDPKCKNLYFAPGNGATNRLGTNVNITDLNKLADFAVENNIDLTVVGPEDPLTNGVVDLFRSKNLAIFGPTKAAARLEGSKAFMKNFLAKHNIPTAKYIESSNQSDLERFIDTLSAPIVVKADGLCAGKGVIIAESHDEAKKAAAEMLSGASFGDAGKKVVVEEFLDGFELSVFALSDGKNYVILPACQDHKRLLTGDKGPNTGGMGAYCPTPLATNELMKKIENRIIKPTIDGMAKDGTPFEGVLFTGVMVVNNEPYTLEFNVRFGDPECEELMALLDSSAVDLFMRGASKNLAGVDLKFKDGYAVGVVVASKDYPYKSSKPTKITVEKEVENAHICYAGVGNDGVDLIATGGRVLVSVGVGDTIKTAQQNAYKQIEKISFDGMQYRTDIAWQVV